MDAMIAKPRQLSACNQSGLPDLEDSCRVADNPDGIPSYASRNAVRASCRFADQNEAAGAADASRG